MKGGGQMKRNFLINISFTLITLCFCNGIVKAEVDYSGIKDKETLEIIKKASSITPNPNISGIMLLLDEKFSVKSSKQAVLKRHVIIKVLREAGRELGTITIPFNEYFEKVKLNIARTIQPNGNIQNVSNEAIKDESPFTALPIYSDIKIKKITFPNVGIGSIIEYEIEFIRDNKSMPGFSYMFALPMNWTFSLVRFSAEVPKGTPVKFKAERFINNEPIITSSGNNEQYAWQIENIWSKGSGEIAVPNYMKVGQYVIFSTIENWQKINDWAIELMKDQCSPDETIEKKVAELTSGTKESKKDIIEPLFNYVSGQVRYVAIELGMSAYKPYPAAEVFRNGYGDCKGKSALLIAMLKSVGISAYPVLLTTSNAGFINKDIPSFNFNHMIVAVPDGEGYMFLDPTADVLSFEKIPYLDQGCDAFILAKDKKEDFAYIPLDSPENNKAMQVYQLALKRDLSVELVEDDTFAGQLDWENRLLAKYTPPEKYKKFVEESARIIFPSLNLKDLTHSDYTDLTTPFKIKASYTISNYARKSANLIIFKAPLQEPLPSILFTKTPREAPLYLKYPFVREEKITIQLPEGYKIKTLPQNFVVDKPTAYFSKEIKEENKKIIIETKWILKTNEISVGKYGALRSMIESIRRSIEEDIILEEENI